MCIRDSIRSFLDVIIELFKYRIIDYKLITPSSLKLISKNKLSNVLSGFYFRSSIMNPIIPYTLSKRIDKPFKVFTPTLGWSSYLLGMLSNPMLEEYVGVDVIEKVCETTKHLSPKTTIYCSPSEDLDKAFMDTYHNHFDLIFFSPPYYQLELYQGDKQSTNRYTSYHDWLEGYWRQTMRICRHVLKDDGIMYFIIGGYKYKKKYIDLEADMSRICIEEHFTLIQKEPMTVNNIGFTKHREAREYIFSFNKSV